MSAPFLQQIDWSRPWLCLLRETAQPVLAAQDWRCALNAAARARGISNHLGLPLHFVPQADLPAGVAYEAFISATGGVPTRENLHDFFNALVWLTFPRIKKQLNALQAAELAKKQGSDVAAFAAAAPATPIAGSRGKLRDAATIFDENAALVVASDDAWVQDLRAHRWQQTLYEQRAAFGQRVEVFLFGHALMEKLVTPYKAITAHTWILPASRDFFSWPLSEQCQWLDETVARQLQGGFHTGSFNPLPILGVPGWWPEQDAAFYADASVFRPKRVVAHSASGKS